MDEVLLESGEGPKVAAACRRSQWRPFAVVAVLAGFAITFGYVGISPASAGSEPSVRSAVGATALSSAGSKYTKVQYLGFQIFSTPGTTADGCFGNGPGSDTQDECYLGSPKVTQDLAARLDIMVTALENAHASPHWDRSPSVLKVFVAPEFYWRGSRGAYRLGASGTLLNEAAHDFFRFAGEEKFADWLIVPGTLILAELVDSGFQKYLSSGQNVSYFNVAPILVGGTQRRLLEFKHFISGIDFIQASPRGERIQPVTAAPGSGTEYCRLHPDSNGCVYDKLPEPLLKYFGFEHLEVVQGNVFELEGLRVGIEVCLDHAEGRLGKSLGPSETVDLHLITSAGMNIGSGPVGTRKGGPVLLSDGYAETSMSLNEFGGGRDSVLQPNGQRVYNVGLIYESDVLIGMQQWLGDSFSATTGTGFGTNAAGRHGLPGGSAQSGLTGITFNTMSALGSRWRQKLAGYYNLGDYDLANTWYRDLDKTATKLMEESDTHHEPWGKLDTAFAYPTIDFYGPVPLQP